MGIGDGGGVSGGVGWEETSGEGLALAITIRQPAYER